MAERVRNEQVSVTTSSSNIASLGEGTSRRTAIVLTNVSNNVADVISVALGGKAAVAGEGVILAKGASFTDSDSEGYQCYQGNIQAICATANGLLAIMER